MRRERPVRKGSHAPIDRMDDEELEFVRAIDAFKRERGIAFPSWREVLQIVKRLGYVRMRSRGQMATGVYATKGTDR